LNRRHTNETYLYGDVDGIMKIESGEKEDAERGKLYVPHCLLLSWRLRDESPSGLFSFAKEKPLSGAI
jgi:hypothetical protein